METQDASGNYSVIGGGGAKDSRAAPFGPELARAAVSRLHSGLMGGNDSDGSLGAFASAKLELCFRMVQEAYVLEEKDWLGGDLKFFLCDVRTLFEAAGRLERELSAPVVLPVKTKPDWVLTERDPRVKAFVNRVP